MARVAARTFSHPDDYGHAVRAAQVEGYVTERPGTFHAGLLKIEIGKLWVQAGADSAPRSVHINVSPERAPVFFLRDEGQAPTQQSGVEISANELVFFSRGASHYQRTTGPSRWASMSLDPTDLAAASFALIGHELSVPAATRVIRPAPGRMARLASLHDASRRLAGESSATLHHLEAARGLEQALTHALVRCLDDGADVGTSRCWPHHVKVMARFEEWLEASLGKPVYLAAACAAVGVSERTLRACCQEQLGMSPNRYLILRRMGLARATLLKASPGSTTVAAVAMDAGFWELGRFSVAYRNLFGEPPRVTLARPAGSPR